MPSGHCETAKWLQASPSLPIPYYWAAALEEDQGEKCHHNLVSQSATGTIMVEAQHVAHSFQQQILLHHKLLPLANATLEGSPSG